MIEKGKGLVLSKLKTIQLIEADMQLLMRILINIRNKFRIEKNKRIAKGNYGSRPHYSIEDIILKKRLVYINALMTGAKNIYNMTDLEAYYDRKLAKIDFIMLELVGAKRKLMQLLIKILLIMQYHAYTEYRAST
jgi:hypothetical protein